MEKCYSQLLLHSLATSRLVPWFFGFFFFRDKNPSFSVQSQHKEGDFDFNPWQICSFIKIIPNLPNNPKSPLPKLPHFPSKGMPHEDTSHIHEGGNLWKQNSNECTVFYHKIPIPGEPTDKISYLGIETSLFSSQSWIQSRIIQWNCSRILGYCCQSIHNLGYILSNLDSWHRRMRTAQILKITRQKLSLGGWEMGIKIRERNKS